jgi:mRNA degradation ribonuclease J1/J2
MRLMIAGGCGESGRNCFYVEGEQHAYIVDCGMSTDGLDRVPDLTAEQIRRAEFLFLTHSHRDHAGAIEYAENMGFTGPVLMSNRTYQQLKYKPVNTMILDSTAPELELLPEFTVTWGLTGHCAGSVWYKIDCEGKKPSSPGTIGKAIRFTAAWKSETRKRTSLYWMPLTAGTNRRPPCVAAC